MSQKNNHALAYYLASWQGFIASLTQAEIKETWHQNAQFTNFEPNDVISAQALASRDLQKALEQYRLWKSQPIYCDDAPEIWRAGATKLMNYGGNGMPILMVPSMINGHEILHMPGSANLATFLQTKGFHLYILDWGNPSDLDRSLTISDYQNRLRAASGFLGESALLGYCLGGTISNFTELPNIKSQVLIGAPWKFQHDQGRVGTFAQTLKKHPAQNINREINKTSAQYGVVPSIYIDYLFAMLNPLQFIEKFRNRGKRLDLKVFDAVEDWLTSGYNLAAPFTRELLIDGFRADCFYSSAQVHTRPTLAIFGAYDHIAPPKSCQAIANTGKKVQALEHNAGHVGLLMGHRSRQEIWPRIAEFLAKGS